MTQPARDDLVLTGEAVALDLPVASVGVRALSGAIDLVVALVLVVGGSLLAAAIAPSLDAALGAVVSIVLVVAVLVALPTAAETLTRGRTLGKLALGLRVVRSDAGPVSFRHSLVRALVGVVEIYLLSGVPALVSAVLSPRGQRIGDLVAGTYVVRERFRLSMGAPRPCPPELVEWARAADLADPPVGLAVAARRFLLQAPQLDPRVRAATAARLAAALSAHVAPPPPASAPAEDVVAAVVAQRRERDLARLRREVGARRRVEQHLDLRNPSR